MIALARVMNVTIAIINVTQRNTIIFILIIPAIQRAPYNNITKIIRIMCIPFIKIYLGPKLDALTLFVMGSDVMSIDFRSRNPPKLFIMVCCICAHLLSCA